jgi:tight adherence protein B
MEKAGAFADRAMGQSDAVGKVRFRLIQSGSTLQSGEFGAMVGMGTLVVALLLFLVLDSIWLAPVAFLVIPFLALSRLKSKAAKRVTKLENQLPEALQLIAGSLDSGTSLLLGMELAGEEGESPLADELARVVAESSVGRPLLEALDSMSARIGSKDIAWTVKAIRIQHQTGGRLADTLRILADFMHSRQEVRGEVRALSAEARISGKLLIFMPISIAIFLYITRRDYIEPLFTTGLGNLMLGAAGVGLLFGHLWMKKLAKVEV